MGEKGTEGNLGSKDWARGVNTINDGKTVYPENQPRGGGGRTSNLLEGGSWEKRGRGTVICWLRKGDIILPYTDRVKALQKNKGRGFIL